jgi:hypothetical protein
VLALGLAALVGLAADPIVPTSVPSSSPTAELVTVTLAGVAAIITAAAGFAGLRRRRQNEADALPPTGVADPEDRPSRLRERLSTAEARLDAYRELNLPDRVAFLEARGADNARRIGELEEKMDLRRAADVVIESGQHPPPRRARRVRSLDEE